VQLAEIAPLAWVLLLCGGVIIGISKTGLPGGGSLVAAVFAAVLPAKESTGTLLVLLIAGDIFALAFYSKHADWRALLRLTPAVLAGVAVGAVFLGIADDTWTRIIIGTILLALAAFTVWRRWIARNAATARPGGRIAGAVYGTLGGFTTMVANSGGPVMSLYFLSARLPVQTFLGTAAWFFAVINLVKLPISISLGLINGVTLTVSALLIPALIVGAIVGRWIARGVKQHVFDAVVLLLTIGVGLFLVLS